jgi:hypothetical protein
LRNLGTEMVLGVCFLEDRVLLQQEDKDGILLAARVGGTNLPIRGEINIVPLPDPFRFSSSPSYSGSSRASVVVALMSLRDTDDRRNNSEGGNFSSSFKSRP